MYSVIQPVVKSNTGMRSVHEELYMISVTVDGTYDKMLYEFVTLNCMLPK